MTDNLPPVQELSYEQARDQLVATVRQLEGGQVPLEDALKMWERGEELAKHCQAFLDSAKQRLDAAAPQQPQD
ncbi:exodeoxyribonuclease VII small subunit [Winkia sp. UMB3158]|uniref:Exodeoxyribonuclease 7 small subunit n=3 Tax=Bacillati TaxID=1783272 RepID=K0YRA9_9ACTO|nr:MULTISPECIES: exodeoxyribonuclease VII small subunit [Winkia]MDK8341078.1 exodeoxyribonuclease VII small subunit [Winkia sp. UMB3164B]OFT37725.1 exodeoxyribonuclease VII small subunit [Actinomyces sp. HMSC08A01]EJZ85978.1 exodeoxyribonuclease VII, small subunit [Winkia neuii BV029A5]MDK6240388.1 exodeoxyribonuclease VII small subunit [Winkia sp. UMB10116]MDK7149379.1 exodeoxyribonuclease VII small subunit [Winkia sp. UMB3158]